MLRNARSCHVGSIKALVCCILLFICGGDLVGLETGKKFRAGAAAVDITPWMGLSIEGNMHDHKGTDVHDPLHARCVVLDDGSGRLAIVLADSCMIPRKVYDEAKKIVHERSGLPAQNILMAATHTHSAPAAVGIFQATADPEYQKFLSRRLADSVLQAINHLEPAAIGWGKGTEPRHVSNRRWKTKPGVINRNLATGGEDEVRMNPRPGGPEILEPAGPTDPEVSVLAVRSARGRPIALLANYSMHYCGGVGGDGVISADYFGVFCNRMAELLGADRQEPSFVAMLSNGTSGDCNSTDFRQPPKSEPPFTQIHRVANDVAAVALDVYQNMKYQEWIALKSAQKEISLGVRRAAPRELEEAKARLANAKHRPNGQLEPWTRDIYDREAVLLSDYPANVPLVLQAFRIGDLGIAAIPCEVFAEIGLELKKKSALQPLFTIELANGYNGYLPTPRQHKMGGYETWRARSSYLEIEASDKITSTVLALLESLK